MDETVGATTFPVDLEGSLDPGQLPDITVRNDTHIATMASYDHGSPSQISKSYNGRLSPVRGRTIKEYDKQISDLKKENFNLKIRIFHMEERMQQRYGDGQDVYKLNIELQVQVEKLKKDLAERQDLIQRADVAMDTLRANSKQEEESMRNHILSQFKDEINRIQALLEDSNQECERYRKEFKDAADKIQVFQQDLNSMNADLCKSNREKDDLIERLKNAEFDVQHLTAQLKLAEQSKSEKEKENFAIGQHLKDLNDQLQLSQKEISRNKRDMQDEIDDALAAIKRKEDDLVILEESLKQKDNMVGNLEDTLRDMEKKLQEAEAGKKKAESELEPLQRHNGKIKKSYENTIKTLVNKDTELKSATEKLNAAMDDIKSLQEALKEMKQEKSKALDDLTKELTDLEVDNRRLKLQLDEAEGTIENFAMTLGKKEGELAGFQDQLKRAMDALRNSDDAVEALHNQLKAERAEFDKKLREESLKHEMNANKQTGTCQEKMQQSDSEKMESLRHSREMSALADELEAIKVQLHDKDLKIQALENPRVWIENHNTVQHFTDMRTNTGELPLDLLVDLKRLLEQLQKEMTSLSSLHHLLPQLNKSGDTATSAELLLSEISSVQKIYRQLEGGVEKNSQLHRALLNSLRGERRQSNSPDSNSCQDGGYNLGPSNHMENIPGKSPSSSIGTSDDQNINLGNRSFQTEAADVEKLGSDLSFIKENTKAGSPFCAGQAQQNEVQSHLKSPGKDRSLNSGHSVRHSHVHFSDDAHELRHTSLTDDAKGIHPLNGANTQRVDFFNCSPGVLFDEDNFDLRAHDRASSARFDARNTGSLSYKDSESAITPPSIASSTRSTSNSAHSAVNDIPEDKESYRNPSKSTGEHAVTRKGPPLITNGNQADWVEANEETDGNNIIGNVIDFNNHRSNSILSPGGRTGQLSGKSPACHREGETEQTSKSAESDSEKRSGDKGDQRSRRNSWAEELEQYRVHDQDRGTDQQSLCKQQQSQQITATMSAVELRDLVAQLQVDLVDAIKENKALHEELKAVPKQQAVANGHMNPSIKVATKSKIPRLNASSSCHSTTSEDSDQIDSSRNKDRKGDLYQNRPAQSNLNRGSPAAVRNRSVSGDQEVSSLQSKLNESHTLIKNLQNKLHGTENTVRLLSKKNKVYVSALESAGISATFLNRSNSESCLSAFADTSLEKAAMVTSLNSTDQCRRLASLLSPLKSREMGSMENNRAFSTSKTSLDENILHSSPPLPISSSQLSTITSWSPVRNTDTSASSSASCVPQVQETTNSTSQIASSIDISEPGVYFKVPVVPPASSFKSNNDPSNKSDSKNYHVNKSQEITFEDQSSPTRLSCNGLRTDKKHPLSASRYEEESLNQSKINQSLIDVSTYPDVTYTSLLDGTLLNRLHQITNMDHSLPATATDDVSSMNIDQLQGRLEHLERVNLTLREEINVYEAIHRSQGTQVSPSLSTTADNTTTLHSKSDDDLLKQHLVEIRKLRHRLERLDITKDPEQLLIFQSHTQQRITRQETMLAHLQQQLVEKEEQHLQECAQLQHRLAREKVAVGERLEQTITDLRKQLEAQVVVIEEREQNIQDLKLQLQEGETKEKLHNEEMKKIMSEKTELGDDLVKRDKEFLEMEKLMFKLEMGKESADSDCKRMESELEERDKECANLTKELEDSKENSKCLKEIIVRREKSLQEKVYNLQKVSNEKSAFEQHVREKENQVKKLEADLTNLRKEMHEIHLANDNMKGELQSEIQNLKSDLRKKEDLEARNAFQKASYEAEIGRLTDEKIQMKASHEKELDSERMQVRRQIEDLRNQLRDKQELESELEILRERVKTISELQYKIERLELQLDHKAIKETELQDKLDSIYHVQSEAKSLHESLERNENCLKVLQEEKTKILQDLKEREEKLKKRDKQLKNLISQHMKLETTFSKQKNMLKEKTELIYSQKKQLRLFEVSLTASSQEEKDDIMKQLLKELIATQRQVEELLSRLEQNPISQPAVRVETFGMGHKMQTAGLTTTVTTSGTRNSSSSGQDNVDTVLSVGVREGSPEICLGTLSHSASEGELEAQATSQVGADTVACSSTNSSPLRPVPSPLRPVSTNFSPRSSSHYPVSPKNLRYYADVDSDIITGVVPQSMVGSDIRSLFAVFKLESHEKLRKESNECLVALSTIEARLDDRLRAYKTMSVSESIDYSTLRETSMSCRNLRKCLEEAVKLVSSAWITELPPVDASGHFYDPVLAEQNENLKHDLTLLRSRHDILGHTVKEQEGRLQASKERHRNWEQSLYKQLHKTAQDMEKAKENFDAAGMSPKKNLSLKMRSPNKISHKSLDDTY